jgi:FKBP-type peptidyl-prolyl cis-trans isomerase (trigger factor)
MTRQELEQRMDQLARKYVETHDEAIKAELKELSRRIAEMRERLICQ